MITYEVAGRSLIPMICDTDGCSAAASGGWYDEFRKFHRTCDDHALFRVEVTAR